MFLFFVFYVLSSIQSQPIDKEYQKWAKKVINNVDQPDLDRGKQMGCTFCTLMVVGIQRQFAIMKDEGNIEQYTEEDISLALDALCETHSPKLAKRMTAVPQDVFMICKRILTEYSQAIMDAISLGEDTDSFCVEEANLCTLGIRKTMEVMSAIEAEHHRRAAEVKEDQKSSEL